MGKLFKNWINCIVSLNASACADSYYNQELEKIGARRDLSGVSFSDICDAASSFTYDAPSGETEIVKRLLTEVLNRGNISRGDYDSALTGDAELGMSDRAATCAWDLPDEEEEYKFPAVANIRFGLTHMATMESTKNCVIHQ